MLTIIGAIKQRVSCEQFKGVDLEEYRMEQQLPHPGPLATALQTLTDEVALLRVLQAVYGLGDLRRGGTN